MSDGFDNISISQSESLTNIEEQITKLVLDKKYKIRLPGELNTRGALGIEVAIIQLMAYGHQFIV